MPTTNLKYAELLQGIIDWHENAVDGVKTLIEHADKPMEFDGGKTHHLTEAEVGPFRRGLKVALVFLGTLPLVASKVEGNDAEQFNQLWPVGSLLRIHDPVLMGFKVVKTVAMATMGKDGAIVEINQSPYFVKCEELIPED
ncbi:hypothetical protein [Limnobaculum xujianqingii]|uniref:hypothetical protein n=1 Tax=Limnobaculum xujianqingii TaxID=2738837 RepID=UPI001E31BBD8|nr:hypothetical protein [Limnobaculum xujianqingii]